MSKKYKYRIKIGHPTILCGGIACNSKKGKYTEFTLVFPKMLSI